MTITQLIDELRAVYAEHGDVPVLDGRQHDFRAVDFNVVTIDDWDNGTVEIGDDGAEYDIPAVGYAVSLGRRF